MSKSDDLHWPSVVYGVILSNLLLLGVTLFWPDPPKPEDIARCVGVCEIKGMTFGKLNHLGANNYQCQCKETREQIK